MSQIWKRNKWWVYAPCIPRSHYTYNVLRQEFASLHFHLLYPFVFPSVLLLIVCICFYFSLEIFFFCLSPWLNNLNSLEGNLKCSSCVKSRMIQYLCWNSIRWITSILLEVSVSSVRKMTSPPLSSKKLGEEKVRNLSLLISRACVYQ